MSTRRSVLQPTNGAPSPYGPASRLGAVEAYRPGSAGIDRKRGDLLDLSANEGPALDIGSIVRDVARNPSLARRYPDASRLEARLAARFGVRPEQVLVTAGADDALHRLAMSTLEPGRVAIATTPTFEMIRRYIALSGAQQQSVPWIRGPFPVEAVLASATEAAAAVFIVSPNNPTGGVITSGQLRAVRAGAPHPLLILDHAYAEFADEDLTTAAVRLSRTVVVRTFSKAWGLAGLRIGYAIGEPEVIGWLRRAGNPYAVSALSLAIAERALEALEPDMLAAAAQVRTERGRLSTFLQARQIEALPSQGNFVLARFGSAARAEAVFNRLLARSILVRALAGSALVDALRISCPADEPCFQRLLTALTAAIDDPGDRP